MNKYAVEVQNRYVVLKTEVSDDGPEEQWNFLTEVI